MMPIYSVNIDVTVRSEESIEAKDVDDLKEKLREIAYNEIRPCGCEVLDWEYSIFDYEDLD